MTTSRRYDSALRQEQAGQTRAAVLAAAAALFVEHGWSGTSMRDIARTAGCSVETVYSSVGNKRDLLKVVLDVAVVGDDEPVPLFERPEFRALHDGDLRERAAATGRLVTWIAQRTARLYRVLQWAAAGDAEIAKVAAENRANHRASVRAGVIAVARREVADVEVDGIYALLSNEVYLLLVDESGWTDEQYRTWVADTVVRLLDNTEEQQP